MLASECCLNDTELISIAKDVLQFSKYSTWTVFLDGLVNNQLKLLTMESLCNPAHFLV